MYYNRYNLGDYTNKPDPLSLKQLSLVKVEKKLGGLPGREVEKLHNGPLADSVQAWDNKTGLTNMEYHYFNGGQSDAAVEYAIGRK